MGLEKVRDKVKRKGLFNVFTFYSVDERFIRLVKSFCNGDIPGVSRC